MQQLEVNYRGNYDPVVNWISASSILSIASIHEFPTRSIYFVLSFPQADLDVNVFMEITLVMGVNLNRGEWVLKLNKSLYILNKESANWVELIRTGLESMGCHQSHVDLCVFTEKTRLF